MILSPIWARFLAADLFYSILHFIKVIRVLLFLVISNYISSACRRFSTFLIIDIFIEIHRLSMCLGIIFLFSSLQTAC